MSRIWICRSQRSNKAGCEKIFTDKTSGTTFKREGLEQAKSHLRGGDTIVVWRLDRLGRSLKDLLQNVANFQKNDIEFASLHENIDTSSPAGKLVFHIFASLAEFERDIISQRTKSGLQAARARGKLGGRRQKLDAQQRKMLHHLYQSREMPIHDLCSLFKIFEAHSLSHFA